MLALSTFSTIEIKVPFVVVVVVVVVVCGDREPPLSLSKLKKETRVKETRKSIYLVPAKESLLGSTWKIIKRKTERKTERETERETERKTERKTERETSEGVYEAGS